MKKTICTTVMLSIGGVVALFGKTFYDKKCDKKERLIHESFEKEVERVTKPLDDVIEQFGEMVDEYHDDLEKHKKWLNEHRVKDDEESQ